MERPFSVVERLEDLRGCVLVVGRRDDHGDVHRENRRQPERPLESAFGRIVVVDMFPKLPEKEAVRGLDPLVRVVLSLQREVSRLASGALNEVAKVRLIEDIQGDPWDALGREHILSHYEFLLKLEGMRARLFIVGLSLLKYVVAYRG